MDADIDSAIGARQGPCEGPIILPITILAAMVTLEWPESRRMYQKDKGGVYIKFPLVYTIPI